MWLEAVVAEPGGDGTGGKVTRNERGTPQSGVISPLLKNLFLHWFDALFHGPEGPSRWADARLAGYADDMVILAREWTGELTDWVEARLEGKFGLEINREKTRVVEVKPGLPWVRASMGPGPSERQPGGWANYFSSGYPRGAWWEIDWFVRNRLIVNLQRRSQRPHRPPKGAGWYEHIQSFGLKLLNKLPGKRSVHA